jgi:hypothetical protein
MVGLDEVPGVLLRWMELWKDRAIATPWDHFLPAGECIGSALSLASARKGTASCFKPWAGLETRWHKSVCWKELF